MDLIDAFMNFRHLDTLNITGTLNILGIPSNLDIYLT